MQPRVAVLSGFGINCESETMAVFEMAGAKADRVHVNRLVNGEINLNDYHIMAVPGGFSFGDHLGSGRLMGNRLRFGLREQVRDFVKAGKPVIGICNTWSEFNPCNAHFRDIAERVKRGVYEAGGFPLEFPVFSASESNLRPTAMLFRNLASMDVEEAIRGNPMDGVVLLMGCDKTTPSLLMGAASVDRPRIGVSGGPMLNGHHRGEQIGSGTGVWKLDADLTAGKITEEDFVAAEISMSRSKGNCMTMGTASTMGSMVEALGISLPNNAAIPAVDARRYALAHMSGKRIVEMVKENLRMSKVVSKNSFE